MKLDDRMFRVLALGCIVAWGISFLALDSSDDQVFAQDLVSQEMLEHIAKLGEAANSYHAESVSVTERDGKLLVTKGKAMFKWPNMWWKETRRSSDEKLLGFSISNGKIEWIYIPRAHAAVKYEKQGLDADAQKTGWLSAGRLDEASLRHIEKDILEGEDVYIFEGKLSAILTNKNLDSPGNALFYVGAKDGIVRMLVSYNQEGRVIGSTTYSNIRIDTSISERDFEFVPPEGTQVEKVNGIGSRIRIQKKNWGK